MFLDHFVSTLDQQQLADAFGSDYFEVDELRTVMFFLRSSVSVVQIINLNLLDFRFLDNRHSIAQGVRRATCLSRIAFGALLLAIAFGRFSISHRRALLIRFFVRPFRCWRCTASSRVDSLLVDSFCLFGTSRAILSIQDRTDQLHGGRFRKELRYKSTDEHPLLMRQVIAAEVDQLPQSTNTIPRHVLAFLDHPGLQKVKNRSKEMPSLVEVKHHGFDQEVQRLKARRVHLIGIALGITACFCHAHIIKNLKQNSSENEGPQSLGEAASVSLQNLEERRSCVILDVLSSVDDDIRQAKQDREPHLDVASHFLRKYQRSLSGTSHLFQ
mmetsp:Transcript_15639/g.40082  ORF Transcript_15639/g.40082 Transcript_15639/m.40082 type:complete len:328 (+) Transcript_15639:1077-2060(+)